MKTKESITLSFVYIKNYIFNKSKFLDNLFIFCKTFDFYAFLCYNQTQNIIGRMFTMMKKRFLCFLTFLLTITMLSGCGTNAGPTESVVTTVDENVYYLDNSQTVSGEESAQTEYTGSDFSASAGGTSSRTTTPHGGTTTSSGGTTTVTPPSPTDPSSRPDEEESTVTSNTTSEENPQVTDGSVQIYGRYIKNNDGSYSFDWSGSTVQGGFNGTEIAVVLSSRSVSGASSDYMAYSIDGGAYKKFQLSQGIKKRTYTLATGLSDGYHTITLSKCTEGAYSTIVTFYGFDYLSGEPAKAPARPTRSIEFIGDSITAGSGSESTGAGDFKLAEENFLKTYAYYTANELHASFSCVAVSGAGVYQNTVGDRNVAIPNFYDQALKSMPSSKWDFSDKPDVVVVNLGTNDFANGAINPQSFIDAYEMFINRIRSNYPNVYIVCTIGPIDPPASIAAKYIEDIVEQRKANGDSRIAFCQMTLDKNASGFWGSGGHPTEAGHREMYHTLCDCIKQLTGWN